MSVDPEGDPFTTVFAVDGAAPFLTVNTTSFAFVWDVSALPDGPHTLTARATDERGNSSLSHVSATVLNRGPNAAPSLTVETPMEGDVLGAATRFSGKATDERGELTGVYLSIDGSGEVPVNGTATWTYDWNATGVAQGPHLLQFRSWDGIDFSAAVFVNVTLNLSAPASLHVQSLAADPTTALPGESVILTGRVVYDTGAGTPSAAVTATVRGFPALFETVADFRGLFKLNVTAPAAAGNYTVEAVAIEENLSGGASTSLRVSTATLPDIELLPSDFSLSPSPPVPNEAAHHTLNVRNVGAASADVTVRVYEGGSLVFEWTGHVQSSRQASFDRAYAPGWHNLTIRAEDIAPQDANLSNNELLVSIEVPGLPDFAVESLTPSLKSPRPGENITFLVLVSNVGLVGGTAALEVWDGVPLASNATLVKQEFISLAPGDHWRSLAVWTPTPGNHTVFAKVVLSQPLEANLVNNELNVSLVVPDRPAPPPPSLLPGFAGPVCAAALVAGAMARRGSRGKRPPRPQGRAAAVAVGLLVTAGFTAAWIPGPTSASLDDAAKVPGPLEGVCQTCHMDPNGGGPLNPFGADYWSQRNETAGNFDWTRLGALDSDGDGYPNAREWNDSYLPGDPDSNPSTGRKYQGFAPGGVSGLVAALLALLFLTVAGVWLGFSMFRRRAARHEAASQKAAVEAPAEALQRPPATPKP
jgi:hypothetical protein